MKREAAVVRGLAACSLALASSVFIGAVAPDAIPVAEAHAVDCTYVPYVPYKNNGIYVKYGVAVRCNDAVDVRSMTLRLWRYRGGRYEAVAQTVSSNTAAILSVSYNWVCSPRRSQDSFHTEVVVDAFHGNWSRDYENSREVRLVC